ncbi:hypothetical protein GGR50DRAFT_59493 [Xylaria sp. CBS 124048]|nr:hypothetical protein GGR50DRAFT_59493 [Xylaria sp. CBS 124048]
MASKAAVQPLRRIVSRVEVERKFNPGRAFAYRFLPKDWNASWEQRHETRNFNFERPSFTLLKQPSQLIRDTYFDTQDGHLSKLGLWVRKRDSRDSPPDAAWIKINESHGGANELTWPFSKEFESEKAQWNAKSRLGGHFNSSQFVELDGKQNISDEVLRITGGKLRLEDLEVVADLQTHRSSWKVTRLADGTVPPANMTIVMDRAFTETEHDKGGSDESAFSHDIGEVELFQEFVTEGKDSAEHEEQRKQVSAQMMEQLKKFMLANMDLFSTSPPPSGKLSAYFEWKKARRG